MRVILVHGGVGVKPTWERQAVLREAALSGYQGLERSLLDAVESAVRVLEDSPLFNAGYGSELNLDGEVEMDAAIIDGEKGRFGAVAAIKGVTNPVSVARRVLEDSPHVLLAGDGATRFARKMGFPEANCVAPERRDDWLAARKGQENLPSGTDIPASPFLGLSPAHHQTGATLGQCCQPPNAQAGCDTVGCVAIAGGKAAAASSTGGWFMKWPGRVGDTPVLGGGIFASHRGAVVASGVGEVFIEILAAKAVDELLGAGLTPQEAAVKVIRSLGQHRQGFGGVAVVGVDGRVGAAHNTASFPVCLVVDGQVVEEFLPVKVNS